VEPYAHTLTAGVYAIPMLALISGVGHNENSEERPRNGIDAEKQGDQLC